MPLPVKEPWFGVVLESDDPQALARFYEKLLGWTIWTDGPTWVTLAPSRTAGYNLAFQREDSYVRPTWPSEDGEQQMMMHLDLQVDDLEAGVRFAEGCGAEQAAFQPQQTVRVMLDPAGHPFCLYTD